MDCAEDPGLRLDNLYRRQIFPDNRSPEYRLKLCFDCYRAACLKVNGGGIIPVIVKG